MAGCSGRRKYDGENHRLPDFYNRFRALTDNVGGVTRLHKLTGISRPTIQFWYNGQRTPDAENLITLSRAFGVSTDWLLGLTNDGNYTNDQKLSIVSEYIGLSNQTVKEMYDFAHR